jgi:hypothetical protein
VERSHRPMRSSASRCCRESHRWPHQRSRNCRRLRSRRQLSASVQRRINTWSEQIIYPRRCSASTGSRTNWQRAAQFPVQYFPSHSSAVRGLSEIKYWTFDAFFASRVWRGLPKARSRRRWGNTQPSMPTGICSPPPPRHGHVRSNVLNGRTVAISRLL